MYQKSYETLGDNMKIDVSKIDIKNFSIREYNKDELVKCLLGEMNSNNKEKKLASIEIIKIIKDKIFFDTLDVAIFNEDKDIREKALEAMKAIGGKKNLKLLKSSAKAISDSDFLNKINSAIESIEISL